MRIGEKGEGRVGLMDEDRGWVYVVKISKMGMPSPPPKESE